LVELLVAKRHTEKTRAVVDPAGGDAAAGEPASTEKPANGHAERTYRGRTPASAYAGATKVAVPHPNLKPGDACPECPKGKVYAHQEPRPLVRVVGQAPLAATLYELERLRCNACGQLFTAPAPEGVGPEGDERTGVFTSAVVSVVREAGGPEGAPRTIALYFSGRAHAGENLAKVLQQRAAELGPAIQMSDALSRNAERTYRVPKLGAGWNCC
jgi:hypothetical protein